MNLSENLTHLRWRFVFAVNYSKQYQIADLTRAMHNQKQQKQGDFHVENCYFGHGHTEKFLSG